MLRHPYNTLLSGLILIGAALQAADAPQDGNGVAPVIKKTTPSTSATTAAASQSFNLELETMTLTDCEVVTNAKACDGKAVLIAKASSKVEGSIKLPKGDYNVLFWIMAPSLQSDTVWVTIGDAGKDSPWEGKCKSCPDHKKMPMTDFLSSGVYVNERTKLILHVTEEKDIPIVITPKEFGMLIDRIQFRRIADAKK